MKSDKHIDFKLSVWHRLHLPEDADLAKVKEILEKYPLDIDNAIEELNTLFGVKLWEEDLEDTAEFLSPKDNGDQPTIDLFLKGNSIWENSETKPELIRKIREITGKYGSISTGELEAPTSPVFHSDGVNHALIEKFNEKDVTVVYYINETEVDEREIGYDQLNYDQLSEVLNLCEQYVVEVDKMMDRVKD